MFSSNAYRPETRPLGYLGGHPIYLATAITIAHIVAMLIGAAVGFGAWQKWAAFAVQGREIVPALQWDWHLWRWVTWPFVSAPSIWWALGLYFFFRFGREVEVIFGRQTVAIIYGGLMLLAPALCTVASIIFPDFSYVLLSGETIHFCVFLAFCFIQPQAAFFTPALTAKLFGSVFFALKIIQYLGIRDFTGLTIFLASCGFTYYVLRKAGMGARFERISDAFSAALPRSAPKLKVLPPPAGANSDRPAPSGKGGKYYEPKIKPKTDIAPERKAVEDVNALLDKVAATGLASLTPEERAALERASAKLREQP